MNREQLKLLVEEVNKEMLDEVSIFKNKNPFKAMYVLGPAGAGKTHIVNNFLGLPSNFKNINSDEAVESVFPLFDLSLTFASSKENPELAKKQQTARQILRSASQSRLIDSMFVASPLLIDTTGENHADVKSKIEALTKLGYDVGVTMVGVPEELSLASNARRTRKVPSDIVKKIHNDFMDISSKEYVPLLKNNPNVFFINEEPYMNLYNLRDFSLRPSVTPEMESALGATPEKSKAMLASMKQNISSFLTNEPQNETGKILLNAMRALVKATGGRKGQNLADLAQAHTFKEYPEVFENSDIVQGMIKLTTDPAIKQNVIDAMSRPMPATTIRGLTSDDD